jgi:hypothetical protein
LNSQIVAEKSESSFGSAWDLYHNSFADNGPEVIDGLHASFKMNAKHISPLNLNGTVRLFRELGENDRADEIIELYIKVHQDNPRIFDLREYNFASEITDKTIRNRFAKIAEGDKIKSRLERFFKTWLAETDGAKRR